MPDLGLASVTCNSLHVPDIDQAYGDCCPGLPPLAGHHDVRGSTIPLDVSTVLTALCAGKARGALLCTSLHVEVTRVCNTAWSWRAPSVNGSVG